MRYLDKSKYGKRELKELKAKPWMIELLKLNPSYCSWGPHEDYMWIKEGGGCNSPLYFKNWSEFNIKLDELNEVVNFYFEIARDSEECEDCEGTGYNSETKKLHKTFYSFQAGYTAWGDKITQDEVDALIKAHRCPAGSTAADVNEQQRHGFGHDCINKGILVETRARRMGVWGKCPVCKGKGYLFTEAEAHVNLVLWLLHPRKGASRGVEIKNITEADLPAVFEFLREAGQRSADKFNKIPKEVV